MVHGPRANRAPHRLPYGVPVNRQRTNNTCVPASLDMLLEAYQPGRDSTLLESYALANDGMLGADMSSFIAHNLHKIGRRYCRGSLDDAIASGVPFIAIVSGVDVGHAVMVDGVETHDGIDYLQVRDPLYGGYLERREIFESFQLLTDSPFVEYPTVWGEVDA